MVVSENNSIQSKRTLSDRSLSRAVSTEEEVFLVKLFAGFLTVVLWPVLRGLGLSSEVDKVEHLIESVEAL